jgi:4-diphosphocytidyl-2-C-methyl-D-erythritol kinase
VRKLPVVAMDVVLAKPDAGVPTARAYSVFDEAPTSRADTRAMLDALSSGNRAAVAAALANDLGEAARTLVPDVGDALAFVAESPGVLGAAVAGSGSCVFGICRSREEAEAVASAAEERGWWSAATSASPVGALVERRA